MHREATLGMAGIAEELGHAVQKHFGSATRGRRGKRLVPEGRPQAPIAVERLAKQALLVAEGGIEARRIDAHGPGQVAKGRALIALAPKHFERPVERVVGIESAGAANRHGLFT